MILRDQSSDQKHNVATLTVTQDPARIDLAGNSNSFLHELHKTYLYIIKKTLNPPFFRSEWVLEWVLEPINFGKKRLSGTYQRFDCYSQEVLK